MIVDEVHERSIDSDFLLIILRELLRRRPDLKLVLMSATLNAMLFAEYFRDFATVVIDIPGRTFPVNRMYLEHAIEVCKYTLDPQSDMARAPGSRGRGSGGRGSGGRGSGGRAGDERGSSGRGRGDKRSGRGRGGGNSDHGGGRGKDGSKAAPLICGSGLAGEFAEAWIDGFGGDAGAVHAAVGRQFSSGTIATLMGMQHTAINNELIAHLVCHIACHGCVRCVVVHVGAAPRSAVQCRRYSEITCPPVLTTNRPLCICTSGCLLNNKQ